MSKTMNSICQRAQRVGMDPDHYIDYLELQRREAQEAAFFAERRTCSGCGIDSVPKVIGGGEDNEAIDICPNCGAAESFGG
jgi:predicted  nucleic acid-binding Zn-ribbon protein